MQAAFSVLKTAVHEQKVEEVRNVKFICAENANEGFRMIDDEWRSEKQFVMSMDVKKCFDSIRIDVLMDVVNTTLNQSFYRVLQYDEFIPSQCALKKRRCVVVPLSCDVLSFVNAHNTPVFSLLCGSITSRLYSREEILGTVKNNLSSYFVHVHHQYYTQIRGIPQGSILSMPLCNLYLRVFERTVLTAIVASSSLLPASHTTLIRFVDDYLVITTDTSTIQCFHDYVLSLVRFDHRRLPLSKTNLPSNSQQTHSASTTCDPVAPFAAHTSRPGVDSASTQSATQHTSTSSNTPRFAMSYGT